MDNSGPRAVQFDEVFTGCALVIGLWREAGSRKVGGKVSPSCRSIE